MHVTARPRRARFDGAAGLCFIASLRLSSPFSVFTKYSPSRTFSAVAVLALLLTSDLAEAVPLRVRGRLQIAPKAARARGALEIRGTVTRDDGSPASVPILVGRAGDGALPSLTGCRSDGASRVPVAKSPGFLIKSDDSGRFCVRFPEGATAEALVLTLAIADSETDVGTKVTLDADAGKRNPSISFHPVPHTLPIDGSPNEPILITATATSEEDGVVHAEAQLPLSLRREDGSALGAELAHGATNEAGEVTFSIAKSALGTPGPMRIMLVHEGGPESAPAKTELQATRVATVQLEVGFPTEPVSSEDGFFLPIRALAAGHPVEAGSVEVAIGETVVGAARLAPGGSGQVPVAFARNASGTAALQVRYISTEPWLRPGPATVGSVATKGPNPFRRLGPLLGTVLLAFAAFALRRRTERKPSQRKVDESRRDEAPIALPLPAPREVGELVGRVVDRHDGTPIGGAVLTLLGSDFSGGILAESLAEADGTFRFSAKHTPGAATLTVRAPFHRESQISVGPASGAVCVTLLSRRRGVLDDLVTWARSSNDPPTRREPTPAEIAQKGTNSAISAWASAVEAAGFSEAPLDAEREAAVGALRPPGESPREPAVARVDPAPKRRP